MMSSFGFMRSVAGEQTGGTRDGLWTGATIICHRERAMSRKLSHTSLLLFSVEQNKSMPAQ